MKDASLSEPLTAATMRSLPEAVARTPSMMSRAEKQVLHSLVANVYRGDGIIVDVGTFLGGSTSAFASGLVANSTARTQVCAHYPRPIVSIDRGIVTSHMASFFRRRGLPEREPGESFVDLLRANIASWDELIDLRIGDLAEVGKVEAPIEILFLDALKNPALTEFSVRHYFPKLIAGTSFVIQQDYFYHRLPFIKIAQEWFENHFDYVGEVASSALFRCRKAISQSEAHAFSISDVSVNQRYDLSRQAERRSVFPQKRFLAALSAVQVLIDAKQLPRARRRMDAIARQFARHIELAWGDGAVSPHRQTLDALAEAERLLATGG